MAAETSNGDYAAQVARDQRSAREGAASARDRSPYLKVNTPNEYPQSSWGHVGRKAYGGSK